MMGAFDFTREVSTPNTSTGRPDHTTVTIPGDGVEKTGDPLRYETLQLRESEAPTILWAPEVYLQTPDRPAPGDRCTHRRKGWTVQDVSVVAPDGNTIVARVIIGQ